MEFRKITAAVLALAALALAAPRARAEDLTDATEIMKKNFVVQKLTDSKNQMTMTLVDGRGTKRERKVESYSKLLPNGIDQQRVARFLAPPDVKGTATLTREDSAGEDDIWVYLPALKKVRRLVASNKRDSFMGSDFSYNDVITPRVEDYGHKLLRGEDVDGVPCYVIESTPGSEKIRKDSGYSRSLGWIRKDNFVTLKVESADLAGRPYKEFRAYDIFEADPKLHRWMARRITMKNVQTGSTTELRFDEIKVNIGVKDDYFTERYLERQ